MSSSMSVNRLINPSLGSYTGNQRSFHSPDQPPFTQREPLLSRNFASGTGSSIVHGNLSINSVTYSDLQSPGNQENRQSLSPDTRQLKRARHGDYVDDDDDDNIQCGHYPSSPPSAHPHSPLQSPPPIQAVAVSKIPIEIASALAQQYGLTDDQRLMLFSFHRVCFFFDTCMVTDGTQLCDVGRPAQYWRTVMR